MAAAAIPIALDLASKYLPAVITLIKQIKKKDGSVVTIATIVATLDEGDADFQDNLRADADWFAAHGMNPDGSPMSPISVATVAKPVK